MRHAPDARRDLASPLRVGVLSLRGVEEACYGNESRGTFVAFSFDNDLFLRAYMENPLRVMPETSEGEAERFLTRPDLACTESRPSGKRDPRPPRRSPRGGSRGDGHSISIDLVVTSHEDLRAAVRLGHRRYDILVGG